MQYLCARDTSVKSCQLYPADIQIRSKIDETLCRVGGIKSLNFVGSMLGKGKTSEEKKQDPAKGGKPNNPLAAYVNHPNDSPVLKWSGKSIKCR